MIGGQHNPSDMIPKTHELLIHLQDARRQHETTDELKNFYEDPNRLLGKLIKIDESYKIEESQKEQDCHGIVKQEEEFQQGCHQQQSKKLQMEIEKDILLYKVNMEEEEDNDDDNDESDDNCDEDEEDLSNNSINCQITKNEQKDYFQQHNDHAAYLTAQQSANSNSGRWTKEEHSRFMEGLHLYGKNWKKVEEHVGSRTGAQIRSHAQKFFNKLERDTTKKHGIRHQHLGQQSSLSQLNRYYVHSHNDNRLNYPMNRNGNQLNHNFSSLQNQLLPMNILTERLNHAIDNQNSIIQKNNQVSQQQTKNGQGLLERNVTPLVNQCKTQQHGRNNIVNDENEQRGIVILPMDSRSCTNSNMNYALNKANSQLQGRNNIQQSQQYSQNMLHNNHCTEELLQRALMSVKNNNNNSNSNSNNQQVLNIASAAMRSRSDSSASNFTTASHSLIDQMNTTTISPPFDVPSQIPSTSILTEIQQNNNSNNIKLLDNITTGVSAASELNTSFNNIKVPMTLPYSNNTHKKENTSQPLASLVGLFPISQQNNFRQLSCNNNNTSNSNSHLPVQIKFNGYRETPSFFQYALKEYGDSIFTFPMQIFKQHNTSTQQYTGNQPTEATSSQLNPSQKQHQLSFRLRRQQDLSKLDCLRKKICLADAGIIYEREIIPLNDVDNTKDNEKYLPLELKKLQAKETSFINATADQENQNDASINSISCMNNPSNNNQQTNIDSQFQQPFNQGVVGLESQQKRLLDIFSKLQALLLTQPISNNNNNQVSVLANNSSNSMIDNIQKAPQVIELKQEQQDQQQQQQQSSLLDVISSQGVSSTSQVC